MDGEFQTESVVNRFKEMAKLTYPNGCHVRQYADLLATFLAGYIEGAQNFRKACLNLKGFDQGDLFMGEMIDDSIERGKFIANCMMVGDFGHDMFKVEGLNLYQ